MKKQCTLWRWLTLAVLFTSCAEEDIPLSRIIRLNSQTNDIELASKKYLSKTSNITITVVPLMHFAEQSFYDFVNQTITNKTVLYEDIFSTHQEWLTIKSHIEKLPRPYPQRFSLVNKLDYDYYAEAYGFKKQIEHVDYALGKEAIHADISAAPETKEKLLNGSDQDRMTIIDGWVTNKLKNVTHVEPDTDKKLIWLDQFKKSHVDSLKTFFSLDRTSIDSNLHIINDLYRRLVLPRDAIVIDKLRETLARDIPPLEIVIAYGYLHMVTINQFIEEVLGFFALPDDIKWIKVMNINKPKI